MKNLLFIFFLLTFTNTVLAKNLTKELEATYKVTYGSFLELGLAKALVKIDKNNNYLIRIEANTTGMAKLFSNNRSEIYESKGKFIDNNFQAKTFTKIRKTNDKTTIKTYKFDYLNKTISYEKKNFGKNKKFTSSKKKLDFFTSNDILSLFFNLKNKLPKLENNSMHSFVAVGANKQNGKIDILMPNNETKKMLDKILNKDNEKKFIAYINQKIFSSAKGELYISLNNKGFCGKAILKDVILFGDIVGEMTQFKIKGE